MRYVALAVDFDGTLAHDGRVDDATVAALVRLRASGRRLLLVTGRELPDLVRICAHVPLFDLVVAENGGLLYSPATREESPLAPPPPPAFVEALKAHGVGPISVGRVVVATWQPHEAAVLDTIHALGLEHQVIFNKGAVMVLPPTVNKATGLVAALRDLRLSPHNVVAVGDAENDQALFALAECAVAVANALPTVKEHADLVTAGDHGAGVVEVIDALIADDLRDLEPRPRRHDLPIGTGEEERVITVPSYGVNVLIAGSSGSGKSTVVAGILERMTASGYQYCTIDPEGDYESLANAVVVGAAERPPAVGDGLRLLDQPGQSAVVNLLGVPIADRPAFFAEFQRGLLDLRGHVGRPHWLVLDEAHHLLPIWGLAGLPTLSSELNEVILVTVDPAHVVPGMLSRIDILIVTGRGADATIASFCRGTGETPPPLSPVDLPLGEALIWRRRTGEAPVWVRLASPRVMPRRHRRKYAQGEIDAKHSFYFRGRNGGAPMRASNLRRFQEIAGQIDDETWLYHLRRGDFARWFRDVVKDEELAIEADRGEALADAAIAESRELIRCAIDQRYTLPA